MLALRLRFCRRRSITSQPNKINVFNSAPPPVRATAAAALNRLNTKDIIKKIITPPMSPSSPSSPPPTGFRVGPMRSTNNRARSPPAPSVTSPKSGSKYANRKASDLGVFKADFVVSEKTEKGSVFYLIRLYSYRVRISSRLARA
jgi:hypothetical protein